MLPSGFSKTRRREVYNVHDRGHGGGNVCLRKLETGMQSVSGVSLQQFLSWISHLHAVLKNQS